MFKTKKTRAAIVGAAVFAVIAGAAIATSASAATQSNGSDGPVYIGDSNTNALIPAGTVFGWTDDTFGFLNPADVAAPFACPADATGSFTFLAPKGQEHTKANWKAWATNGFVPGTKNVSQWTTSLYAQNIGDSGSVKAAGGDYSIGLACTINNGVGFATSGIWYASIHITPVTGAYTVDQPDAVATPTPTPTTPAGAQTANLNLKATTVAAQDGVLSLIAPASSTVLIGNPVVDPNTHLSVSTGSLGQLTVADGRVATHKGWDLTTAVTNFVKEGDATATIPNTQLGFAPKIVSTPASGVTKAVAQVAGTAVYQAPFASADNSATVGNTVLNADLTFVAPATATAGTYDSTLTLTLTSK